MRLLASSMGWPHSRHGVNRVVTTLAVLVCIAASLRATGESAAGAHLLAGVRAFREQRFEAALTEFQLAQQAGSPPAELPVYLGPTLYKLGRYDEARQQLAALHRRHDADGVADYYLGMSYYRLGFLQLARGVFAKMDARSAGPRLAEGALRFVAEIDRQPKEGPPLLRLLVATELLEHSDVPRALDAAEEAFLRAAPGSAQRARAGAVLRRLAPVVEADEVIRAAVQDGLALPR